MYEDSDSNIIPLFDFNDDEEIFREVDRNYSPRPIIKYIKPVTVFDMRQKILRRMNEGKEPYPLSLNTVLGYILDPSVRKIAEMINTD